MSRFKDVIETGREARKAFRINKKAASWLFGATCTVLAVYEGPTAYDFVQRNYLSQQVKTYPTVTPNPTSARKEAQQFDQLPPTPRSENKVTPTAMEAKLAPTKTVAPKSPTATLRSMLVLPELTHTPIPLPTITINSD